MAGRRHNEHLNQYLKSHKNQSDSKYSVNPRRNHVQNQGDSAKSSSCPSPNKSQTKSEATAQRRKPPAKVFPVPRGKASIGHLPDEILLQIFAYMGPSDLLALSRVCTRWLNLTNDNLIWKDVYHKYVKRQKSKPVKVPERPPPDWWKSRCISIGAEQRTRRLLPMLKKINQYTKLPANTQKILVKSDVRWQLTLTDSDSIDHTFRNNDAFHFNMSTTTRWYSLEFPPLTRIKKLKAHSMNPVFFDHNGNAHQNSPCQRSLLFDMDFNWSKLSRDLKPIGNDDMITAYVLPHSMILATWKDGGELAFISLCLHSNHLVERCFLGSSSEPYVPPPRVLAIDDIDRRYGLHDYSCTIELRNQRAVLWSEHFRGLNSRSTGGAVLVAVDPEDKVYHHTITKNLAIPWKTDLFKNILQEVCIMDLTVLEEHDQPIWCTSTPVKVSNADEGKVDFEFDGLDYVTNHEDPHGKVYLCFNWDGASKIYNVTNFTIDLKLDTVNAWFGTKYK